MLTESKVKVHTPKQYNNAKTPPIYIQLHISKPILKEPINLPPSKNHRDHH